MPRTQTAITSQHYLLARQFFFLSIHKRALLSIENRGDFVAGCHGGRGDG